jgi:hypothetical protein
MDGCTFTPMTFSSLASFYVVCASTKCCSTTLFSLNFSMNTISTDVALSYVYSFTCQCLLLLRKNSIAYVLVVFISWIIICTNCIFSLYDFLSTHPNMIMNVMVTLYPMAKYSTHIRAFLFSTPLLLLFFSTILLPPLASVYVHSSMLPFPLLFCIVS